MYTRMIGVFCVFILLFSLTIFRVFYLSIDDSFKAAAQSQSTYTLDVAKTKAQIYDRNLIPLVNTEEIYIGAVIPTPESASTVLSVVEDKLGVLKQLERLQPFLISLPHSNLYAPGLQVFTVKKRYGKEKIAPHVIGYLDGDGKGKAGIEKTYNDFLEENGYSVSVRYLRDAAKRAIDETPMEINSGQDSGAGIVLTLDKDIQIITQEALTGINGSAVVMDSHTGDIRAMVSYPDFNQNDISKSLKSENSPMFNRAINSYAVGSTFKLVVAAAALEKGYSPYTQYECEGYIDVDGHIFYCNNRNGHGVLDLKKAITVSCNPFFVDLALKMDIQNVSSLANAMGFGRTVNLTPDMKTNAGNMPLPDDLPNKADIANFSFGQGEILANPVQICQMVATIANKGMSVSPKLLSGKTLDGKNIDHEPEYAQNRIIKESTAKKLYEYMINVVENGSGVYAKPETGIAGGKTASAQTGVYIDGKEIIHAWFVGFYEIDNDNYTIVVFAENGNSGADKAAPVFKKITEGITKTKK